MQQKSHLGTLKMASRLLLTFMVASNVPTKTRLRPLTVASLQPLPRVILSPVRAFCPLMLISLAMLISFSE